MHWLAKANSAKQVNQVRSMSVGVVQGLNINVDFDAARFWYLGHGTTFFSGGDGSALFTTSHSNRAGASTGTSNNFGSGDTHRPFSSTALVDAVSLMNRFVGQNGEQLLPIRRARILCSIELFPTVQKILDSVYGPDSPNLGKSAGSAQALAGRGVKIDSQVISLMPNAYKNYWFVVDLDRANDHLYMCWGWKPRLAEDTEIVNGSYEVAASVLVGPSCIGWQFAFGSQGNSSAIS